MGVFRLSGRITAAKGADGEMNPPSNLLAALPVLLPKATAWAEAQEQRIRDLGRLLRPDELSLAVAVGVKAPQLIRILEISSVPMPKDVALREAAMATGLLGPTTAGITFGYGICVCQGQSTVRLLSHEFRHVFQYEQAGSIAAFLKRYLEEIVTIGYASSPLEKDARAHEVNA